MKHLKFNLATTPLLETLSQIEDLKAFSYNNLQESKQVLSLDDIRSLAIDLLAVAGIDNASIIIHKLPTGAHYNYDKLEQFIITIDYLGEKWKTEEMYVAKNRIEYSDYVLFKTINLILDKYNHKNRFISVSNSIQIENEIHKFFVSGLWMDFTEYKNIINQLNSTNASKDLIESDKKYFINYYASLYCNSDEHASFRFIPILPNNILIDSKKTEVSNSNSLNFEEHLKQRGIKAFHLLSDSSKKFQFICETLALLLKDQTVNIYQDSSNINIVLKEEHLILKSTSSDATKEVDIFSTAIKTINNLLKKYKSTKRIFFYNYDYSHNYHYFICDLSVGEEIFDLCRNYNHSSKALFSRLDLYLEYNDIESVRIGVSNESRKRLLGIEVPNGKDWEDLFTWYLTLNSHKVMPSNKWNKEVKVLIDKIGKERYSTIIYHWLVKLLEKTHQELHASWKYKINEDGWIIIADPISQNLKEVSSPEWVHKVYGSDYNYSENNAIYTRNGFYFYYTLGGRILRGIIHSAPITEDRLLLSFLDDFAIKNPNESADVIHAYSQLPASLGVPRLTYLRTKIKKKNIQTRIETALKKISKDLNLTQDELEEIATPNYSLNKEHRFERGIANFKAIYTIINHKKTELVWVDEKNNTQLSIPAKIKKEYTVELKDLKDDIKEIENQLSSQKKRIESFFTKNRVWKYDEWLSHYINHPLVGSIGKYLIWHFDNGAQKNQGIWQGNYFVDVHEQPILWLSSDVEVQLWHPIGFNADYVIAWRTYLQTKEITQPFKQAFREIYLITDAELETHTYSNRFAGHILNKDHFGALCKTREWTPNAMATGMPTKRVSEGQWMIEYLVSDIWLGEHGSFYGSAHITTDQVRFYRHKRLINLEDIPATFFSELMRDIDLFVGVASIGNNPNWQDRGDSNTRNYWNNYAFGELSGSSKTREDALKTIIPKLKISHKCSFDGKFLKVKGHLREYKIHMGSGNVLMLPNDQFLCIVADFSKRRSTDQSYIPFEGDDMLSIIISKAFLLADDHKISDETILQQIKRK